jgi:ribonucleoside-diphosphate reductase alpha chain
MALIHQSGGGTGFSFSNLRPSGDLVKSTKGVASGPVSFMRVFDTATDVIKQGGKRRGANMGVLRVDHPDILEFINAKSLSDSLQNFNISVAVTDEFMHAVENQKDIWLVNPRNGEKIGKENAKKIFDSLVDSAWKTGDPGLIFIDEINRKNPTPQLGKIESTNPCGEVPLLPWESCNLGSINLNKVVGENGIMWEKLKSLTWTSLHFLDNVIEANNYPFKQIEYMTNANRKVGLGVMGFADTLIKLGIPYNSEQAIQLGEKLMEFIHEQALAASSELAKTRGSFPNFPKSVWHGKFKQLRNATVTSIAPTGSISIIAGCSSGIEPLFSVAYYRRILGKNKSIQIHPLFEKIAKERGIYSKKLVETIIKKGSLRGIKQVPEDLQKIFVTALDIKPEWHVKMQSAFQKNVDNAVSKTVNLPETATKSQIRNIFLLAWKLKCKGITVYRYGSKQEQVLEIGT